MPGKTEIKALKLVCFLPIALDLSAIRRQFPILDQTVEGHPLVYLDNAATVQKPRSVIDAMTTFYERDNANPHRGMHVLAERATDAYEGARSAIAQFINAAHAEEIVFTKNATESINLVARGITAHWKKGDAVVLSRLEHHSNIVPWLQAKQEHGIEIRWMDMDEEGHLDLASLERLLQDNKVKLVALSSLSNVLGIQPPVSAIIRLAHRAGALTLIDAAQAVGHLPTDVQALDCDFLVFSGHKLYGPTGIGVLYGKTKFLSTLEPLLGGGMMIQEVCEEHFVPADIPARFEGGTPPVAEAVGLGAAVEWLRQFRWEDIDSHERSLLALAQEELQQIPGMHILGPNNIAERSGSMSFSVDGIHAHDLTDLLGQRGICLRAGHHCAQPLHHKLGLIATSRLSVAIYNTPEEIRCVAPAIRDIQKTFTRA